MKNLFAGMTAVFFRKAVNASYSQPPVVPPKLPASNVNMLSLTTGITLMIAILFCASAPDVYSKVIDLKEISQVATQGLPVFLGKIPAGFETGYGFASIQEIRAATLGTPYQTHTVYIDDSGNERINSLEEWRFPILVNNSFRALLTVSKIDGAWKTVDFGAAELARDIFAVESARQNNGVSYTKSIVRNHAMKIDFLAFSDSLSIDKAYFAPLLSARKMMVQLGIAQTTPSHQPGNLNNNSMTYKEMMTIIRNGLNK